MRRLLSVISMMSSTLGLAACGSRALETAALAKATSRQSTVSKCRDAWNIKPTIPARWYEHGIEDPHPLMDWKHIIDEVCPGEYKAYHGKYDVLAPGEGFVGTNGPWLMGYGLEGYWFASPDNKSFDNIGDGDKLQSDSDQTRRDPITTTLSNCNDYRGNGYLICNVEMPAGAICEKSANPRVVIVAGFWDGKGTFRPGPENMTLACADGGNERGAIAKCIEQRISGNPKDTGWDLYPIDSGSHRPAAAHARFEACIRAIRGDFCGDLTASHPQKDDAYISLHDHAGKRTEKVECGQRDGHDDDYKKGLCFEALWTAGDGVGAVWVSSLAYEKLQKAWCFNRMVPPSNPYHSVFGVMALPKYRLADFDDAAMIISRHGLPGGTPCKYDKPNQSSDNSGTDAFCKSNHKPR